MQSRTKLLEKVVYVEAFPGEHVLLLWSVTKPPLKYIDELKPCIAEHAVAVVTKNNEVKRSFAPAFASQAPILLKG